MNTRCDNFDLVSNVQAHQRGTHKNGDEDKTKDEVDFVRPDICIPCAQNTNNNNINKEKIKNGIFHKKSTGNLCSEIEVKSCVKSSLERLPIFQFPRKKSDPTANQMVITKERPKFVKSASIARLLGNTYNTKKSEESLAESNSSGTSKSPPTSSGQMFERFKKCSDNHVDEIQLNDFCEDRDVSARALRTISKGLSRLLWRKSHSVDISTPDPEYKVSYLGNVLTGWAKGENCMEKPLATLWRNYTQHNKPDVVMKVKVCPSGLKATTRQHGLTEYWSHRITHCCAPKNYPRIFCWIYRHEGRKLKHELRCHAVLCAKESISEQVCKTLKENLTRALKEFKKDKVNRQNARLSLANSVYDNPSMPRRKILLSVGSNNYRPPLERSKSAPRLMAIEEAIGEEGEEDDEEQQQHQHNALERISCCTVDPIYPAMTLGRRRCRKGHSIRRTGSRTDKKAKSLRNQSASSTESEDDLDKVLQHYDYNSKSPLAGELLSYFDMKFAANITSQDNDEDDDNGDRDLDEDEERRNFLSVSQRPSLSLDDLDNYSDRDDEDVFYNQDRILDILTKESNNRTADLELFDDNSLSSQNFELKHENSIKGHSNGNSNMPVPLDSDEGSISSGCETASTVTTSLEEPKIDRCTENQHKNSIDSNCSSEISVETTIIINGKRMKPIRHRTRNDDSDSEYSDESGYVEYQENKLSCRPKIVEIVAKT